MLFRLAVAAQEKDASPIKSQLCTADAVQQGAFPASSHGDPSFEQGVSTLPASQPVPDVRTQEKRKPTQSSKPPGEQRPRIPGSMVGYIDNAIVKSQIPISTQPSTTMLRIGRSSSMHDTTASTT
jgi:hypothetical protein